MGIEGGNWIYGYLKNPGESSKEYQLTSFSLAFSVPLMFVQIHFMFISSYFRIPSQSSLHVSFQLLPSSFPINLDPSLDPSLSLVPFLTGFSQFLTRYCSLRVPSKNLSFPLISRGFFQQIFHIVFPSTSSVYFMSYLPKFVPSSWQH